MLDFVKMFFGRALAWAQAVGVGALYALYEYLKTVQPDTGDALSMLATGAVIAALVKLVGALVAKFGGAKA